MLSTSQLPAHAVLGLEAFADGDAIRRKASALAMRARLSGDPHGHADAARQAAERLADPQEWLRDSLRWLVLPPGTLERAGYDLEAVCADPERTLQPTLQTQSDDAKSHNLAVVGVLKSTRMRSVPAATEAIGLVANAARALRQGADGGRVASRPSGEASKTLLATMDEAITRRADPRLGAGVAETVRSDYLANMVRPLLEEVRGQLGNATHAHLQPLLSACVSAEAECGGAGLREMVLGPLLERCELAIGQYAKRFEVMRTQDGLESFVAEARGRLDDDIKSIVGCGDLRGAHGLRVLDGYAALLRRCAIRGFNDFRSLEEAELLLERALEVACSLALREELSNELKHLAGVIAGSRCWVCGADASNGSFHPLAVHRVSGMSLRGEIYESKVVAMRSCRSCKANVDNRDKTDSIIVFSSIVLGLMGGVVYVTSNSAKGAEACCVGPFVGAAIGVAVSKAVDWFRNKPTSMEFAERSPMKRLLDQGWLIGDKPRGTD
jgi:hypothetical protein